MSASSSSALDAAQREVTAIAQLDLAPDLTAAYLIQHELLGRRLARGERLAGTKLGFTSAAKMAQMGVSEIIVGQLTDAMRVADGAEVDLGRFIHPRIEPEIAFRLARDVETDVETDVEADVDIADCVDAVAPALEIIDSRYRDFRFSLPDVVADNTSAAAFVIGPWIELPTRLDALPHWDVALDVDGTVVEKGSTADILGHPVRALRALVPLARRYGFPLAAGQVVLAGAATAAVPFGAGLVTVRVDGLGTASVHGVVRASPRDVAATHGQLGGEGR